MRAARTMRANTKLRINYNDASKNRNLDKNQNICYLKFAKGIDYQF